MVQFDPHRTFFFDLFNTFLSFLLLIWFIYFIPLSIQKLLLSQPDRSLSLSTAVTRTFGSLPDPAFGSHVSRQSSPGTLLASELIFAAECTTLCHGYCTVASVVWTEIMVLNGCRAVATGLRR